MCKFLYFTEILTILRERVVSYIEVSTLFCLKFKDRCVGYWRPTRKIVTYLRELQFHLPAAYHLFLTVAKFPTTDKCWKKWKGVPGSKICAVNAQLKDETQLWDRFTSAACGCDSSSNGDGFHCQRRCSMDQLDKLQCLGDLTCHVNSTGHAYCGCPPGYKIFNNYYCSGQLSSLMLFKKKKTHAMYVNMTAMRLPSAKQEIYVPCFIVQIAMNRLDILVEMETAKVCITHQVSYITFQVSYITFQVSYITFQVSYIAFQVSYITFQVSYITFQVSPLCLVFFSKFVLPYIDECKKGKHVCDTNANCMDRDPLRHNGQKYICQCKPGWTRVPDAGTQCAPCQGLYCKDIIAILIDVKCIIFSLDVDECISNSEICGPNSVCTNTLGSYTCDCLSGYQKSIMGDNFYNDRCEDEDECTRNPCLPHSTCENTIGSYKCPCNPGYVGSGMIGKGCERKSAAIAFFSPDRAICEKCDVKTTECGLNEKGTAYKCHCKVVSEKIDVDITKAGYVSVITHFFQNHTSVDDYQCKPKTYCDKREATDCAPVDKAHCIDRPDGSGFDCKCKSGYEGNGKHCTCECGLNSRNVKIVYLTDFFIEIGVVGTNNCSLCIEGIETCQPVAHHSNSEGHLKECRCVDGYRRGEDDKCHRKNIYIKNRKINIRECDDVVNPVCPHNSTVCVDLIPGYEANCKCKDGFYELRGECVDVDECTAYLSNCNVYSDCINTYGSYKCVCMKGYNTFVQPLWNKYFFLNSIFYIGKKRCLENLQLCNDGSCIDIDVAPFYRCECAVATTSYNDTACIDSKYCDEGEFKCPANAQCSTKKKCVCDKGYTWIDVTQPLTLEKIKHRIGCKEVDWCRENANVVCAGKKCRPTPKVGPGTGECYCAEGYTSIEGKCEGYLTTDINECMSPSICPIHSTCENHQGFYKCHCNQGYHVDSRTDDRLRNPICVNTNECEDDALHNCTFYSNTHCSDVEGSFTCDCNQGYKRDQIGAE
uniref:EGF-like domain-containing protein n=1 Tax=Heterorhabditis bacteriophora TaxID=37862 RepID=A0A1I7W648_HETBA